MLARGIAECCGQVSFSYYAAPGMMALCRGPDYAGWRGIFFRKTGLLALAYSAGSEKSFQGL